MALVGASGPGFTRSIAITVAPGLGLFATALGVATFLPEGLNAVVGLSGLLAGLVGMALAVVEPDWYGPRWFRAYNRAFAHGQQWGLAWLPEESRRPGESSVQATERHKHSDRPLPPGKRMWLVKAPFERLAEVEGLTCALMFYPHAPLFSMGRMVSEPVEEVIPREYMVDAYALPREGRTGGFSLFGLARQRLCPETTEGTWVFSARRAEKAARALRRRYLDGSTDMYGLPLPRHGRNAQGDVDRGPNPANDSGAAR